MHLNNFFITFKVNYLKLQLHFIDINLLPRVYKITCYKEI